MEQNRKTRRAVLATSAVSAMALVVSVGLPANADNGTDTSALREAVSSAAIIDHLEQLQLIADQNDGNRAAGTSGYEASAVYIEEQLAAAGYTTSRQAFFYDQFVVTSSAVARITPSPRTYVDFDEYYVMTNSGAGDVTAAVTAVDLNLAGDRASTSGCEASDFVGFPAGDIALIQRGTCAFADKVVNATAAGASAVIVFNQGNADDRLGVVFGTLGDVQLGIPAIGTSFAIGEELAGLAGVTMRVAVDAALETIDTFNVLADSAGRTDRTVVVGAHIDSVAEGAGINDNGSGAAAILETAIQLAESGNAPTNRVRFAFWGGEEDGLIGSEYYVSQLSKKDIQDHAVNLNFDMVGSPNYIRSVYDGDGSAFGATGPNGSSLVEKVFLDYFASQGLTTVPSEFDGRSDYFAFINNGIPAGGLFTGAEGVKTAEEAALFGGTAGAAYDPCYHAACDDINNINPVVLEQMADAIAHSTLTFAETTSAINGTGKGKGSGSIDMEFKADRNIK
ncbi:Zn-dependent M28 family amino/carboxypeptidase [Marisediminicola sp. UYEF4]|uniref:M20/M25/M40 family metallo-hydrolase n=1 Tax=Marisediminicola sp. UYEF4 TaxID=1756384 RepID=UPI003399A4BD